MDESKIHLLFGVHNHQPVGNFPEVFERGYKEAYLPFIEVLERHPKVKVSFHYSGPLWEWVGGKHPDFLKRLKRLLERGQIEILGGGFYEPLLPLIPIEDVTGQIGMMKDFLFQNFSFRPSGFWLTERVWEPNLPTLVRGTGLEYTAIDDTHFFSAGLSKEEVNNYFLTEDQGNLLYIFPIDMKLRYSIPFHLPQETIGYLEGAKDRGIRALTIFDDGEKFGLWPGTHQWVYREGWLEKFFTEIEKNGKWLTTSTFHEYLIANEPNGLVYLPTSSYEEMGQWVLSPEKGKGLEEAISHLKSKGLYERYRPFLKGGFFRNFLRKYPEAKNLYDRMLLTSSRLSNLKRGKRLTEGLKCLYRAQDNDAYWHGVFGGLYLPHLRRENYRNLIKAEVITQGLKTLPRVTEADLNSDGQREILIETEAFNIFLSPKRGGTIYELDYRPAFFNLTDIISRREETYHKGLKVLPRGRPRGQESIHDLKKGISREMAKYLSYDQYLHTTLLDHLLPLSTTPSDFSSGSLSWLGRPPLKRIYQASIKRRGNGVSVSLSGEERIGGEPITIEKEIRIQKEYPELDYRYTLVNGGKERVSFLFLVEFCFANREEPSTFKGKEACVAFRDLPLKLKLASDVEAEWWKVPIRTISQSAEAFDLIDQGILYLPHWRLLLEKGEAFRLRLKEVITK